jgi:hypothetical protein
VAKQQLQSNRTIRNEELTMIVLKEIISDKADASAHITCFERETSGLFYAIYGDDAYAVPVLGWGIDQRHDSHITPLVLHAHFGLIAAWAVPVCENNFNRVVTRSDP